MDGEHGADHALVDVDGGMLRFEHAGEFGDVRFGAAAADDDAAGTGGNERAHLLEPLARAAGVAAEKDLASEFKNGAEVERRFRFGIVEAAAVHDAVERFDGENDADLPFQSLYVAEDDVDRKAALGHVDGLIHQKMEPVADGGGVDHADIAADLIRRKTGGGIRPRKSRREDDADDIVTAVDKALEGTQKVAEGGLRRLTGALPLHQRQKTAVAVGSVFFVKAVADLIIDGHDRDDAAGGNLFGRISDSGIGDDGDHIFPPKIIVHENLGD